MKQRGETLFVAALVIFSAAALWESYGIAGFSKWSSPGVFPMLASATMLVCGLLIFRDARRDSHDALGHSQKYNQPDKHSDVESRTNETHIDSSSSPKSPLDVDTVLPTRVIAITALLALYVAAMPTLGFLLCSGLFLFISISYLWKKSLLISLCTSLVALLIIHIVFRRVFQVVLPEGTLIHWLL